MKKRLWDCCKIEKMLYFQKAAAFKLLNKGGSDQRERRGNPPKLHWATCPLFVVLFVIFYILVLISPKALAKEASEDKIIAVILSREIKPYVLALKGFEDYLNEKGERFWLSQYNIQGNPSKGTDVIKEIKRKMPDMVLTIGTTAAVLARDEIKDIPVVFSQVLSPVTSRLVDSMESSGNNLSGSSMDISYETQLEMLKNALPNIKSVGVLYNPTENESAVRDARRAAKAVNLELVSVEVRSESLVPKALANLFPKIDALWAVADGTVFNKGSITYILEETIKNNIPFMGLSEHFVKAGALMALSCDYYDIGRQSGKVAQQILSGKKPSDIPITIPRKTKLFLNLRIARILGIKIPDKVIKRAEKIF